VSDFNKSNHPNYWFPTKPQVIESSQQNCRPATILLWLQPISSQNIQGGPAPRDN
jgi:hypothetical protein